MDYQLLLRAPRLLLEAPLKVVQGDRFQPTGFADLGPAEYSSPREGSAEQMLLVESAQSVANRLERTCVAPAGVDIDAALGGLPYVAATLQFKKTDQPSIRTTSLVEAHRIASPYFVKNKFGTDFMAEMSYTTKGPLDWRKIHAALFKYDPNSLVHGVFLSLLGDGRVRVPRAIAGFIEARGVKQVVSGGVKNSPVDPKGEIQVEGHTGEKGVYSNVPYARIEYVARDVTAYFNLDLALIRGYGLPEAATKLLIALSLLKVRRFLDSDLRLRTACNFELSRAVQTKPDAFSLAAADLLLSEVQSLITVCKPYFADPAVTELVTAVESKAQDVKAAAV